MSRNNELMMYAVIVFIAVVVGSILGAGSVQNQWRLDSAATSCAQFNPSNGHFEWLNEEE